MSLENLIVKLVLLLLVLAILACRTPKLLVALSRRQSRRIA